MSTVGLGGGLEGGHQFFILHQPHGAGRGAGDLGDPSSTLFRASPRSFARSTALPRGRERGLEQRNIMTSVAHLGDKAHDTDAAAPHSIQRRRRAAHRGSSARPGRSGTPSDPALQQPRPTASPRRWLRQCSRACRRSPSWSPALTPGSGPLRPGRNTQTRGPMHFTAKSGGDVHQQ